jgi:hypothetical protein
MYHPIKDGGFPHSEIPGSSLTYSSPRHIGVSAVLHRLLVPRHPPCALSNLTKLKSVDGFCFQAPSRTCVALLFHVFQCRLSSFQRTSFLKRPRSVAGGEPSKPNAKRQPEARRLWFRIILRKEVIQPHLPIRLPCYDFTPIICPTFGGWLPQGVTPPTSGVTNSRGVTGGVYKARERIHRGMLIHDY